MSSKNPSSDERALRRLERGEATREEARQAVRALLTRSGVVDRPSTPAAGAEAREATSHEAAYGAALDAAIDRVRGLEAKVRRAEDAAETRCAAVLASLDRLPFESVLASLLDEPSSLSWPLAGALGRASFDAGPSDPARALALARLGVEVAARAPREALSTATVADLESMAAGYLGNAYRVAGDVSRAASFATRALRLAEQGTGDPVVGAQTELFRASILRDQRRFTDALRACRRAGRAARKVGDRVLGARALLAEATILMDADDPAAARSLLERSMAAVDEARDARLSMVARHNLVLYLDACGQTEVARERLVEAEDTAARLGHRVDWVRLRWVAARMLVTRGDLAGAEACLLETRDAFLALDVPYDAALAGLELAVLYAEQGRFADVRATAEAIAPVFASQDIHREAQVALKLFYDAAVAERAATGLVRKVATYLEQARGKPELSFPG